MSDVIKGEVRKVRGEILPVMDIIINLNDQIIGVSALVFFMIDGKVGQALAGASSMASCPVFKAKPSEIINL